MSEAFDGGNIQLVGQEEVSDEKGTEHTVVRLRIRGDPYTQLESTSHFQYFSFRSVVPCQDRKVRYVIENAGEASYAMKGARAVGHIHATLSTTLCREAPPTPC